MSFLLDTNVISEARRPTGDPNVRAWVAGSADSEIYLSALTIGEIRQGIARLQRRDPAHAWRLDAWLAALRQRHADRILPVTTEIAEVWGQLNAPNPLPVVDGLLAATALVHGLTLVTRNTADVARTGVRVLNPFLVSDRG